jgi:glutamate formiminotransferase
MLECVVNVSEGRRSSIIRELCDTIKNTPGVNLIHIDSGFDANRTVFTFLGSETTLSDAIIRLLKTCLLLIDMRNHEGNHPRIGALDVCPIIPIKPATIVSAKRCVQNIVERIQNENIQVGGWLYRESAIDPKNYELNHVRRGQYETLSSSERKFDFGLFNPKFGALAIGARKFLIAYNVNLCDMNIQSARLIARKVREKTPGGIPGVRAIGWNCKSFGFSQISCNIVDPEKCSIKTLFDRIKYEAKKLGVSTNGSELIGMAPKNAFIEFKDLEYAKDYLGLDSIKPIEIKSRIIENLINAK